MLPFTFDNQMKTVGKNFIKAGAAFSALILGVSLILYLFSILDFLSVIIISGLFFLFFYVIGSIFIIQQKAIVFTKTTIEIHMLVKKDPMIIDLQDIKNVSIIGGGNYQPKIIIKYGRNNHTITCANTVPKHTLKAVEDYFEANHIDVIIKDK